jgi:putative urate catabolism protein
MRDSRGAALAEKVAAAWKNTRLGRLAAYPRPIEARRPDDRDLSEEDAMNETYPRDMVGYGRVPPHAQWPGDARIAVQFVINYEEGAENSILHGDEASESLLTEFGFAQPRVGERYLPVESMYEYGSRVGFWRLHRFFTAQRIPITVFGVTMALERNPDAVAAMIESDWEIASHGYRWVDHHGMPEETEREHIRKVVETHTRLVGSRPLGYFIGRRSENTVRLVAEEGGFLYSQDSYADELPYWIGEAGAPLLMIPYTADCNDHRFSTSPGFDWGEPFFAYLRDTFDTLYEEGETTPRLMNVGLHCRLVGRPGRFAALSRFVEHVQSHDRVWLCRGLDIARHWREHSPPAG